MRRTTRLALVTVLLGCGATALAQPAPALRSRGLAGYRFRELTEPERFAGGVAVARTGLMVTEVFADTPAATSGLRVGDVVVACDDQPVGTEPDLATVMARAWAGDTIRLTVDRGGSRETLRLRLAPLPRETADDLDIEYGAFSVGTARLRSVVASPRGRTGERLPALFMVSALGSPSLVGLPVHLNHRVVAHRVARGGFRVMRFALRGAGDSEGEDYRTTDFRTEVADNVAALNALMARPDVDPTRVFVFGHSTGGIVAALLAAERDLRGLVVSMTIGRTYYERAAETLRLQSTFAGDALARTDGLVRDHLELMAAVALGRPAAATVADVPRLAPLVNPAGRVWDDRTDVYWNQQLAWNLADVYGRITEPVLVVYGASDFLTARACHEHIRDVLVAGGNGDVTLEVVAGLDHRYARAASPRDSFEAYRTGSAEAHHEATALVADWLGRHAAR